MSWAAGAMLTMGLLILLYVALAVFAAAARRMGSDRFEQQGRVAERHRAIARGGFKSRQGIR